MSECVIHVDSSSLLTTRELFMMIGIKGYSVQYARVPVVESHSPSIVLSLASSHC